MKRLIFIVLAACAVFAQAQSYSDAELRQMAARMLMVGFKGDSLAPGCDAERYIKELGVGGIILFDVDLTGDATLGSRNITTAPRLKALTAGLRAMAPYNLIIAADQEGGLVQRLKPRYGFKKYPDAQHIGKLACPDSTRAYAAEMSAELADAGINLNLAPDIDLHRDDCPVIGKLRRAYSANPDSVALHANIVIDEHRRNGVMCAVKHFPGHGSATADSHYGLTDVTRTWSPEELIPFKAAIDSAHVDAIMTAHIFNGNIDPDMPATLSHKTLTDLLRNELGFKGIILTDDMYMKGIIDTYSIERAVVDAINAGADMLCVGNNISTGYEADRPFHLVDMIVAAVKDGRIPASRLAESAARIAAL